MVRLPAAGFGLERGLSSPQQREIEGDLQSFSKAVEDSEAAADWKVRAPEEFGGALCSAIACNLSGHWHSHTDERR